MQICNTRTTYGSVSKWLHWVIALLVIAMLSFGFFMGDMPKEYKPVIYNIHKLTGLTILFLMLIRFGWMLINPKPDSPAGVRCWEVYAEKFVHWSLYATVIAMPLAGWIGSSAADKPPHIGDWRLMLPIMRSDAIDEVSFQIHTVIAYIIIALLCVHVGAALYHHFIRKDNVLKRMS
jgi:cytochrome b561